MKKVLMGVLSLGLLLGAATGCTSDQEKAAGKTKASSEKTEATSGASANGYTDPSEPYTFAVAGTAKKRSIYSQKFFIYSNHRRLLHINDGYFLFIVLPPYFQRT